MLQCCNVAKKTGNERKKKICSLPPKNTSKTRVKIQYNLQQGKKPLKTIKNQLFLLFVIVLQNYLHNLCLSIFY